MSNVEIVGSNTVNLTPTRKAAQEGIVTQAVLESKFFDQLGLAQLSWDAVAKYLFNVDTADSKSPNALAKISKALKEANKVERPYELVGNLAGLGYRMNVWVPDVVITIPGSIKPYLKISGATPTPTLPKVTEISFSTDKPIYAGRKVELKVTLDTKPSDSRLVPAIILSSKERETETGPLCLSSAKGALASAIGSWESSADGKTLTFSIQIPLNLQPGDYNLKVKLGDNVLTGPEKKLTIAKKEAKKDGEIQKTLPTDVGKEREEVGRKEVEATTGVDEKISAKKVAEDFCNKKVEPAKSSCLDDVDQGKDLNFLIKRYGK